MVAALFITITSVVCPTIEMYPFFHHTSPYPEFISTLLSTSIPIDLATETCISFRPRAVLTIPSSPITPVFLLFISIDASTTASGFPPYPRTATASALQFPHPDPDPSFYRGDDSPQLFPAVSTPMYGINTLVIGPVPEKGANVTT